METPRGKKTSSLSSSSSSSRFLSPPHYRHNHQNNNISSTSKKKNLTATPLTAKIAFFGLSTPNNYRNNQTLKKKNYSSLQYLAHDDINDDDISVAASTIVEDQQSMISVQQHDPFGSQMEDEHLDLSLKEENLALQRENEYLRKKVQQQEELISKLSFLTSKQSSYRNKILQSIARFEDQETVSEQIKLLETPDAEFMSMEVNDRLKINYADQRDVLQSKLFQMSLKLEKNAEEHNEKVTVMEGFLQRLQEENKMLTARLLHFKEASGTSLSDEQYPVTYTESERIMKLKKMNLHCNSLLDIAEALMNGEEPSITALGPVHSSDVQFDVNDDVDELVVNLEQSLHTLRARILDLYFTHFESSSFESCLHQ